MAITLTGYADPLSSGPGQSVEFMVDAKVPEYQVEIVRLIHGDLNPAGPGLKTETVSSNLKQSYTGRAQQIHSGSSVIVKDNPIKIFTADRVEDIKAGFSY